MRRTNGKRQLGSTWALSLLIAAATSSARGEYAVVDLGELMNVAGGASASVGAVNGAAQVAMTRSPDGLVYHAFRWSGDAATDLGTLDGANSYASGVNASGQIAGRSQTGSGIIHAFVWTPGGTDGAVANPQMKDLNPSGGVSQATAINTSGQAAGFVAIDKPGQGSNDRAAIFAGGSVTVLPLPQNSYSSSYAYAINDAGHVAGEAYTGASGTPHGFFYNGATSVEIGDLGGGGSTPLAMNKDDRLVGYSTTSEGYDHAFSYQAGAMFDLGTLGGGHYSYARDVNGAGQIVGGSFVDDTDNVYHAFASDGATMIDLNTLVTSKAADWVLNEATGVNEVGVIVGTGMRSGLRHGFMLRPLAAGDANADGRVDFSDLVVLAQNYNSGVMTNWEHADFSGDGLVDFTDLVALAQNYNTVQFDTNGAALAMGSASFDSDFARAFSSVPEPSMVGILVLGTMGMVWRRRRGAA